VFGNIKRDRERERESREFTLRTVFITA